MVAEIGGSPCTPWGPNGSAVYGIAKHNSGFVVVDSKENEGSEFRVYLPLFDSEVSCLDDAATPPPLPNRATVLVV